MNTKLETIKPTPERRILISVKLSSFFSRMKKPVQQPCLLSAHIEFLSQNPDDIVREDVKSHTKLLRLIGYQVTVSELTEQTESEYAVRINYYREGKLEFQNCWRLLTEYIEKKRIVSQRTFQSFQESQVADHCSI